MMTTLPPSTTAVTFEQLYRFLKNNYKASRFEDRNDSVWGENYSTRIAQHHFDCLQKDGISHVSRHEDAAGVGFKFSHDLIAIR
ncbi:hypothetical protein [Buttiauxella agrestis]|nr:hypothetical protein [Buttiauxella agrestis]